MYNVAYQDPTEEVDEILYHPTEYEQADEECTTTNTESRIAELNVNAWYHGGDVQDVFCCDQEYLQELHQPQAPPNLCRVCGKSFGSSKALANPERRDHSNIFIR